MKENGMVVAIQYRYDKMFETKKGIEHGTVHGSRILGS